MSKQYGLILPGQQRKPPACEVSQEFTKPSIFDESSSESDDNGPPQMQLKKVAMGPSLIEKRKAKNLQEKALAEDPTVFQYDEIYDDMEKKREKEKQIKSNEPKKARYITKLMETAERRKLENELRVERQVQKEREAEGEEFKDKESFVTSAYRKKLEEMRKMEEQNERDDYLEAIGDVTKQKDLTGFYRHFYEQKMGTSKEIKKPELNPENNDGDSEEGGAAYKPIKSGKIAPQRVYRKRKYSEDEVEKNKSLTEEADKKVHLPNNIDADSDFSIDDSSSENESDDEIKKDTKSKVSKEDDSKTIAPNLKSLHSEDQNQTKDKKLPIPSIELAAKDLLSQPKIKRDKSEVWRKRSIGEVYVAAVQRYYERKAVRVEHK